MTPAHLAEVVRAVDALRVRFDGEWPVENPEHPGVLAELWPRDPALRFRVITGLPKEAYVSSLTLQDILGFGIMILSNEPRWLPQDRPLRETDFGALTSVLLEFLSLRFTNLMREAGFCPPDRAEAQFRGWLHTRFLLAIRSDSPRTESWARTLQELWAFCCQIHNVANIDGVDTAVCGAYGLARKLPYDPERARRDSCRVQQEIESLKASGVMGPLLQSRLFELKEAENRSKRGIGSVPSKEERKTAPWAYGVFEADESGKLGYYASNGLFQLDIRGLKDRIEKDERSDSVEATTGEKEGRSSPVELEPDADRRGERSRRAKDPREAALAGERSAACARLAKESKHLKHAAERAAAKRLLYFTLIYGLSEEPTYEAVAEEFGVSMSAVQRAEERLRARWAHILPPGLVG